MMYTEQEAINLLLLGKDINRLPIDVASEYNEKCSTFGIPEIVDRISTPTGEWLIPDEFKNIDVKDHVLRLCSTDVEKERVEKEFLLYEERNLLPMLRSLMYLVHSFRTHNIVWGVGRGSSVASYVLFKLGVHKVDSLKYELDITEFLK